MTRTASRGLVGNVYLGVVSRVLPGMQSAFVDLGLERDAFLYVTDVISPTVTRVRRKTASMISEWLNRGTMTPALTS